MKRLIDAAYVRGQLDRLVGCSGSPFSPQFEIAKAMGRFEECYQQHLTWMAGFNAR